MANRTAKAATPSHALMILDRPTAISTDRLYVPPTASQLARMRPVCQSARKGDPRSAFKRDPLKFLGLVEGPFLGSGLRTSWWRAEPWSGMAEGHRRRRRAASLTTASTPPGLDRTGWIRRGF